MNFNTHYMPNADKGVPFYFYIQKIEALDATAEDGTFWPEPTPEHHRRAQTPGCLFYFDGNRTQPASGFARNTAVYQDCLIYYGSGRFHIAYEDLDDLHIMTNQAAQEHTERRWIAWRPLSFMACIFDRPGWIASNGGISHASIHGPHDKLLRQNFGQNWPFNLIPQSHWAHEQLGQVDLNHRAGLTGDLSLLIGLLAMSIPEAMVLNHLSGAIAHGQNGPQWRAPNFPISAGCT
jgi:hypothetical protein